jgi:hypothetical protein
LNKNNSENIDILDSAEKWIKNLSMINEVFGENVQSKDKTDLRIKFDFPAWLQKKKLPLSNFKKETLYKVTYDSNKVNELRNYIKKQYGDNKQVAFSYYLSQSGTFGADKMQKHFQKK